MRIGEPARKHGIADPDIWHAVRNSMRRILLDDDLTMLIGPATNGALLEIGIREIATAAAAVRADDARLREVVLLARARGRSWNRIALALGVSRQAARQRFADKASA